VVQTGKKQAAGANALKTGTQLEQIRECAFSLCKLSDSFPTGESKLGVGHLHSSSPPEPAESDEAAAALEGSPPHSASPTWQSLSNPAARTAETLLGLRLQGPQAAAEMTVEWVVVEVAVRLKPAAAGQLPLNPPLKAVTQQHQQLGGRHCCLHQ